MTAAVQVNVRAPEDSREVLLRVASLLRSDPSFHASLTAFLDGQADGGMAERLARIEARLAALEGKG